MTREPLPLAWRVALVGAVALAWVGMPVWHGIAWATDRERWWRR